MLTVHKYVIPYDSSAIVTVEIPQCFNALHFAQKGDDGDFFLWCLVNTNEKIQRVKFRIYGTGQEIKEDFNDLIPLWTTVTAIGEVWHLFEYVGN